MSSLSRYCTKCFLQKPIEDFPWKYKHLNKRHTVCKECYAKRSSDWYYDNKQQQLENVRRNNQNYRENARTYVLAYLLSHPCSECGETDLRVLEFHHEGEKSNEVSRLIGRGASLDALRAEIAKCVVLCANCHRRLTADERDGKVGACSQEVPLDRFERSTCGLEESMQCFLSSITESIWSCLMQKKNWIISIQSIKSI